MDERGCAHRTELNRAELSWGATPVVCRSKCVERSAREIEMQNGPIYAAGEYVTCPRINQCMTCFACLLGVCVSAAVATLHYFMPLPFLSLSSRCACVPVCVCDCFDSFAVPPPFASHPRFTYSTILRSCFSAASASAIRPERAQIPSFIPFYPLFTMIIIIVVFLLHLNWVWENLFI